MSQIPDHLGDVGKGWRKLLMNLHNNLHNTDPDYVVLQVKEKFGGLRVYLNEYTETSDAAIREAEWVADRTCELCGDPGTIRNGSWMKTLCDDCFCCAG